MDTGGGAGGGIEKPSDDWSLFMIENNWPDNASIASLKAVVDEYRAAYPQQMERLSELESARDTILSSMVSEDFEVIHERMSKLVRDRYAIAHGVERLVFWGDEMIQQCYDTQKEIVNICEDQRAAAWAFAEAGNQQMANVELNIGVGLIQVAVGKSVGRVVGWGGELAGAAPKVTPASWSPGATQPSTTAPSESSASGVQEAGFGSVKDAGGEGSQPSGRFSGGSDQPDQTSADAQNSDSQATKDNSSKPGHRSGDAEQGGDGHDGKSSGKSGRASGESQQPSAEPRTSMPSSGLGSLPSPSTGSGSGLGSPASGLGSLTGAGGMGGMGGMKPPPMEGLPPGGLSAPKPLLSPPGSPAGGAGSGGGGVPRIPQAQVPVSPVSAAPPVPPSPSAAAASSAGGFGANPAAVQPITPAASPASAASGVPSAAAAPMAVGPMGGSGGGAVPPAAVGPAPTASPGLSQGSIAPASAAAASGASASAAGMSVVPAAMNEEGPAKSDRYGELAASHVRALVPGVSLYKGLAVAVAVVQAAGGVQQLVFATNEGIGFLPEGCFVPAGLIHAFADLGSREFNLKWLGWSDPARILIDYVVTRADQGDPVKLLGLASQVAVGPEVKSMFPQVIPSVSPEPGAKPLEAKRNRHRLEVIEPSFYDAVKRAPEGTQLHAATRAICAAVKSKGGALAAVGGPWDALMERRFPDDSWGLLRTDYDRQVVAVGTMRGGFIGNSQPGGWSSRYIPGFEQLRAWECMLALHSTRELSVEDVLYAAHQAGVDLNDVLDRTSVLDSYLPGRSR